VLYCIIPRELETTDVFERLTTLYKDNPDIAVIVDRRGSSHEAPDGEADRRRSGRHGVFLATAVEADEASPAPARA